MRDIGKLAITLGAAFLTAFAGSFVTLPSIETWYGSINKPYFTPPNWVFAPVWTFLFFLMGVSAYLIWRKGLDSKGVGAWIVVYFVQLLLNFLWSALFFGLQSPAWAFFDILFLWGLILFLIIRGFTISKLAALLLVPYILWVSFASLLNITVALLN